MRVHAAVAALLVVAGTLGAGSAAPGKPLTGDQQLARAAAAPGVKSYAVPVHFDVHLHKPIGAKTGVDGTAYYQAPGSGALVLDKAHGIIGSFFKGTYDLDLVPQTWPANYRVLAVRKDAAGTALDALPRSGGDDIASVVFRLDATHHPIAANWTYKDGSTIALTLVNGAVGSYTLPATATVAVDMPKYKLDGTVTYGAYALNAVVADSVFVKKER